MVYTKMFKKNQRIQDWFRIAHYTITESKWLSPLINKTELTNLSNDSSVRTQND